MKKALLLVIIVNIFNHAQITWMGNEYFAGNNSFLGDNVEVVIQSWPKALNQGAQIHFDWNNNGSYDEWFNLPFRYESGSNNEWRSEVVQMRAVGTHNRRYLGWQTGQSDYISGSFGTFTVHALSNPTGVGKSAGNEEITINWTKWNSKDVIILRKTSGVFTDPTNGTNYNVSNTIGDATVVYKGSETTFTNTGLANGTSYTYKIYSNNNNYYSSGTEVEETPTPVQLSSFNASVINKSVNLKWETATEQNNYGFEVERASNNDWVKIGFVDGSGNSNSPKNTASPITH